jgi:hypothetical protein
MKRRPTAIELETVVLGALIVGSLVWGLFGVVTALDSWPRFDRSAAICYGGVLPDTALARR